MVEIYDKRKVICRDENGFYSDQMIEKLNNGIEFKTMKKTHKGKAAQAIALSLNLNKVDKRNC
jgi:hypothetical protein